MIDDMTPKERLQAISENRLYDRIPHGFALGEVAARLTGIKVSEFHLDAKKQIEASVAAYRHYGLDAVGAFIMVQEIIGSDVVYPDQSTPIIRRPLSLDDEKLQHLHLDDPKNHPKLQVFWQVLEGLLAEVGDEAPIAVGIEGPFSTLGRAVGTSPLLISLIRKDPEYVHHLLENVLNVEIAIVNSLEGYGVAFGIFDPVASGTLIKAEQYRTFAKPYQKRLFDAMTRVSGQKPQCHMCGNTSKILRDIVETGAGMVSVDNMMDLSYVKQVLGKDAVLVGNVSPTDTMLLGTPKDVENDLRGCLKKAWDAPGGYIPSFGCALPIDTPPENIDALFNALRRYGKYPLNPDLF
ncbi:MAG: uroporphyrinogen decarboxylase family protein [Eubacteriales bacterium]